MFLPFRLTRKKKNQLKIFVILVMVLSVLIFISFRARAPDTKKIVSLFISPTPIATQTPTPTSTPIPTNTPTPTPLPTETPTPTPTPTTMPSTSFESYFDEYSEKYKVSKDLLKKIAFCESGVSPGAVNGEYGGMYQFSVETWQSTRQLMGADTNPDLRFGAKEAIETAAFKIANKGERAWASCL